jgi:hypothetical protein
LPRQRWIIVPLPLLTWNISMLLNQQLEWDPKTERFVNNTMANALLDRPMRAPWDTIYNDLVAEL